jgi:hypothetical protein
LNQLDHNSFHSSRRHGLRSLQAADAATSSTLTASSFSANGVHGPEKAAGMRLSVTFPIISSTIQRPTPKLQFWIKCDFEASQK